MIWRIRIGKWRITFTIAPVTDVVGVNSKLDSGEHILMWDFDGVPLNDIIIEMQRVVSTYELPNIYILETKKNTNYIAYCFKRVSWHKCIEIVAYTRYVDPSFFKYGVYREHFTLRVTPKGERRPHLVYTLKTEEPEDAYITDLKNWVKYETLQD